MLTTENVRVKDATIGARDLEFNFRAGQVQLPKAHHRRDVSSEVCCSGAKSRKKK